MGFNKFAWVDAVAAEGRLTEGERFVLTMTAIRYVTYGEDVFHVRQATIAERFATSESTVYRAFAGAKRLGYLVLVQLRQRGRGHHGPNHHRLVIPVNLTSIPEEIPVKNDRNTRQNHEKYPSKTTEIPVTADSSTSGNDTPKGSLIGSLIGSLGEGAQFDDDEPRCDEHRNTPTPPPCHKCKRVREQQEAEQQAHKPTAHERKKAIAADIFKAFGNQPPDRPELTP